MQTLYEISAYIQYIIWLWLLYLAFQKNWFWKAEFRYFYWYIIVSIILLFIQLLASFTEQFKYNNLFFGYIFTPFEVVLLSQFLKGLLKIKLLSIVINIVSILFVIFNFYNAFWGEHYKNPNSTGILLQNLILIPFSLWAFTSIFKEIDGQNIFKKPKTWFVLGILFIHTTLLISEFLYGIVVTSRNDTLLYPIVIIPNILNSIYLLLYLKGISLIPKQPQN